MSAFIRSERISALLTISRALMAEKDLDRLLQLIIEKATSLLEAERSSIFLLDYDNNELYTRVAQLNEIAEIRFPVTKGIAGYAVTHSKLVNIPDAYKDERFNPEVDKSTGYKTRNILTSPMLNHKNETVGVLQVLNKRTGGFGMEDESLIMALAAQAAVAVENAQLYHDLETTLKSFLKTMASAIDARDPTTAGHSERVARLTLKIGKAMGFNETELKMLDYSAALHDVGKIGVPDCVLLKPDKLTPEEFEKMKYHAVKTKEILDNMFFARELRQIPHIASTHHEKLDGSGYPSGLKGNQMSLSAKILAIADVYDALVAQDRPYKKAMTHEQAMKILEEGRDSKFDGQILDVFKEKQLYLIESRQFIRYPLHIAIKYQVIGGKIGDSFVFPFKATVIDISGSGILIGSSAYYPLGTEFDIFMQLNNKDYRLSGRVVRIEKKFVKNVYYLGIALIKMTPDAQQNLALALSQAYASSQVRPEGKLTIPPPPETGLTRLSGSASGTDEGK